MAFDDLTIVTPDAPAPADFSLVNSLGVLDVLQGQSLDDPITVNRLNGSSGDIAMSVSGLPTGMTGTFSPNPVPATASSTTLTVNVAQLAPATVDYSNVTITGTPASAAVGPAARTATAIARVSENCTHRVTFDYVDLRDTGCLTKLGNTYEAVNTEVHVDGLVLTPRDRDSNGNDVLTVDPVARTIKSEGLDTYSVTLQGHPDVPIFYGKIDWSFKDDYTGPVPLDENPTGKPKEVKGIGVGANGFGFVEGLPITGHQGRLHDQEPGGRHPDVQARLLPAELLRRGLGQRLVHDRQRPRGQLQRPRAQDPQGRRARPRAQGRRRQVRRLGHVLGQRQGRPEVRRQPDRRRRLRHQGQQLRLPHRAASTTSTPRSAPASTSRASASRSTPTRRSSSARSILSAGPKVAGKTALTINGSVSAVLADPWIVEVDGDAKIADKYKLASAFVRYSSFGLFEFGGKVHFSLTRSTSTARSTAGWPA